MGQARAHIDLPGPVALRGEIQVLHKQSHDISIIGQDIEREICSVYGDMSDLPIQIRHERETYGSH